MPTIAEIRRISPPELDADDARDFVAPNGQLTLRFDSPWEFAMGGYSWRVTLLDEETVVRTWSKGQGPNNLHPWCCDSRKLAFPLSFEVKDRVLAAAADGVELPPPQWPQNKLLTVLAWAPTRDRVLLVGQDDADLLDAEFRRVARVGWRLEDDIVWPLGGWLTGGGGFFVLSAQPGSDLRFYSGDDGSLVDAVPLDPADVVPYDEEAFSHLDRDRYVLDIGGGVSGVAALLDTWSRQLWRAENNELLLKTYRPVSSTSDKVIKADPHWVSVTLLP